MPYLKSRQYALLHLKQMKEVAQKLYDLANEHNWKFIWLNFQPFSHDPTYRALIKFPKEPSSYDRSLVQTVIHTFDIPISIDAGYPGQTYHDRIENQHIGSDITEPPIPLEPKEKWFWDNLVSLNATADESDVRITVNDPAPNVTQYLKVLSPVCYSVYKNLEYETKEVM